MFMAMRKLFIKTYGCQMNVYDSDRMTGLLRHHGYESVESSDDADLVVLNTCHIREKAAEKVYSELGRLRRQRDRTLKQTGRYMTLAVAGCVAQAEGEAMVERAPFVDLVVGPQAYHRLPEMLARAQRDAGALVEVDFETEKKFDELPRVAAPGGASAFLTIQEGCDKFCTFCVVPYTRGREVSRPANAVLDEARELIRGGAREITLLGQNVNAYRGEGINGRDWGLARLIRELAELEGLERIRYTTSHPRDVDEDLIAVHGDVDKLMPFLHLPVQSGSDATLKAMNRGHTADDYRRIVERLRTARPDLALSSDFIVGFPGETEQDFAETLQLVDDIGFAQSFSFKYSRRPGTPGAAMVKQVKASVADERLARLQDRLNAQAEQFNQKTVGQTVPVMFERKGRHPGQMVGKSPYMQAVHVTNDRIAPADLLPVAIEACHPHSLSGSVVTHAA